MVFIAGAVRYVMKEARGKSDCDQRAGVSDWQSDSLKQPLKASVGAQSVEPEVGLQTKQINVVLLNRLVQHLEGCFFLV